MHRLFDGRVRSYSLINVKTNFKESSCAKKLFLYEFLLSMLSHMNYVHIHSDKKCTLADFLDQYIYYSYQHILLFLVFSNTINHD